MKNTKIAKKAAVILTAGVLAITTAPGVVFAKSTSEVKNDNSIKTEQNIDSNDNASEVISKKARKISSIMSNFVESKEKLDEIDEMELNKDNKKKIEGILQNYLLNYVRVKAASEENVSIVKILPVCYSKKSKDGISYKFGYKIKDGYDKKHIREYNNGCSEIYDTSNDNEKIILNVISKETVTYDEDGKRIYNSPVKKLEDPKKCGVEYISDDMNEEFNNIINNHEISPVIRELTTDKINSGLSELLKEYNNCESNEKESIVKTR